MTWIFLFLVYQHKGYVMWIENMERIREHHMMNQNDSQITNIY